MRTAQRSNGKVRILVADREAIFRLGLKKLFAIEDDLRVVGEAENATELLSRAEAFQPDVVFAQEKVISEADENLIPAMLKVAPKCRVVATASASSQHNSLLHDHSGAAGIILRSADPQLFVECARRVSNGGTWSPKKHVSTVANLLEASADNPHRPVDTLTHREKTVISCLMQGWHNREISAHLSISELTVKNHLRNVYDKTGVSDRLELVLYAIHQRMELPSVETRVRSGLV